MASEALIPKCKPQSPLSLIVATIPHGDHYDSFLLEETEALQLVSTSLNGQLFGVTDRNSIIPAQVGEPTNTDQILTE